MHCASPRPPPESPPARRRLRRHAGGRERRGRRAVRLAEQRAEKEEAARARAAAEAAAEDGASAIGSSASAHVRALHVRGFKPHFWKYVLTPNATAAYDLLLVTDADVRFGLYVCDMNQPPATALDFMLRSLPLLRPRGFAVHRSSTHLFARCRRFFLRVSLPSLSVRRPTPAAGYPRELVS